MLEERMGVAESRANLIARDQVGKLFGQLNEKRQTELGVTGYVWRTVHDNRVRELHEDRDGQHFDWNDPPEETPDDGHPGTPIQCRCYAEPDLTEIFGEALSEPS
jgi:SPP1 gp7 family putative phage head morphogenesis protein